MKTKMGTMVRPVAKLPLLEESVETPQVVMSASENEDENGAGCALPAHRRRNIDRDCGGLKVGGIGGILGTCKRLRAYCDPA